MAGTTGLFGRGLLGDSTDGLFGRGLLGETPTPPASGAGLGMRYKIMLRGWRQHFVGTGVVLVLLLVR